MIEEEEDYIEKYISFRQKKDVLPELIGRRKSLSDPQYPCFYHVHRWSDGAMIYMDDAVCEELNISLEKVKAMGQEFMYHVIHPDDVERIIQSLIAFANRKDPDEVLTYFQRIKLKTLDVEGYTLIITSAKLDIQNQTISCISNTTDQLPGLTKKISNALNAQHDVKQYTKSYLLLTNREREILDFIVKGRKVKDIADELCVSVRTIEQHKKNLYKKLNVNSVAEAIAFMSYFSF